MIELLLAIALLAGQTATAPAPRADLATPAQQRMVHTLWKSGLVEQPSRCFGGGRPQTNYEAVMWGYMVSEKLRDPKEVQKAKLPVEFLAEVVHTLFVQLDAELRAIGADPEQLRAEIKPLMGSGLANFRDVPVDHRAAGAVANLRKVGILTGYPDGSFDGAGTIKLR